MNKCGVAARLVSISLVSVGLLAGMNLGCGKKAAETPAPYANSRNPAAVPPAPVTANPAGARGGPPEAEAYRQKMGPNAKAPGAR
ncbi:MAG: hypothetical protein V4671_31600 [Armatimonadota bacterium]